MLRDRSGERRHSPHNRQMPLRSRAIATRRGGPAAAEANPNDKASQTALSRSPIARREAGYKNPDPSDLACPFLPEKPGATQSKTDRLLRPTPSSTERLACSGDS